MHLNKFQLSFLFSLTLLLTSCGETTNGAPDGSTITLNPASLKWDTAGGACVNALYNFSKFAITVRDAAGKPLNDVDLYITLDLSPNVGSPPVLQFLQLYDDPNWDGNQSTVPANPVSTPFKTTTSSFGTKEVIVRVTLDCDYKAYLSVFSGNSMGSAAIEVKAQ